MDTSLAEHADACSWVIARANDSTQAPYQLTFLSPFPEGEPIDDDAAYSGGRTHNGADGKRTRCRAPRKLAAKDVAPFDGNAPCCPLLRTPTGALLPALYARGSLPDRAADMAQQGESLMPADADIIIESATALLQHRLRRGVKILSDPGLLLRFLQLRLVSQPRPVFAVFFLDRHQRLIRFAEIFHGQNATVSVRPREVVREAIAYNAEQILCVRSDPQGDHRPTSADVEDARRVMRAMRLLQIPVLDYVIVGRSISSLRVRGALLT
jgi:DNA repair protein RadC